MAIRTIRTEQEPVLRKNSKPVTIFDENLENLLDDMKETMHMAEGVGLAAPQIGILKRLFIVDVGEGVVEFINPEILLTSGEQTGDEGCLSVPGKYGKVTRANYIKMKAQNRKGEFFEIEGEELMARAMQHEYDHLEGVLFIDRVQGEIEDLSK